MFLLAACTDPDKGPAPDRDSFDVVDTTDTEQDTNEPASLEQLATLGFRNVVLIHVDTFRQDHLPHYGGERDTLPKVGGLPWMVVDGVHADTSWTIPSTISLLTGLDDVHHGFTHMRPTGDFSEDTIGEPTFPERLDAAGYQTIALVGNRALWEVDGVFRGFDSIGSGEAPVQMHSEVELLLPWLDALDPDQPFFAWLQPMNLHLPYRPLLAHAGTWTDPEDPLLPEAIEEEQIAAFEEQWDAADGPGRLALTGELGAVYDELILGVDDGIATIVRALEERGLAESTLIVLTGDHGETLADEVRTNGTPVIGHGGLTRQELIRVPLMFYHPDMRGGQVDCVAQNTDLFPTLFAAMGIAPVEGLDGRPLQDGCREFARATTYQPDVEERELVEVMVSDGSASLRWLCAEELSYRYDLTTDPGGTNDIPPEAFPASATLEPAMEEWLRTIRDAFGELPCPVPEAE